jgi:hypothetical protein
MPRMLTLQHEVPFAVMSDKCIAKIEQCMERGEDFTLRCWLPKDPDTIAVIGVNVRIATVELKETRNAPDSQAVD